MMREPQRDPRLRRALQDIETTAVECDVHALTQRVARGAGMALLRRRYHNASAIEHMVAWTRAALPLCIVMIIAGVGIVGFRMLDTNPIERADADVVLLDAAAHASSTTRMLDYIVTPSE